MPRDTPDAADVRRGKEQQMTTKQETAVFALMLACFAIFIALARDGEAERRCLAAFSLDTCNRSLNR